MALAQLNRDFGYPTADYTRVTQLMQSVQMALSTSLETAAHSNRFVVPLPGAEAVLPADICSQAVLVSPLRFEYGALGNGTQIVSCGHTGSLGKEWPAWVRSWARKLTASARFCC
jgi:hypothetical protein